jgi:uncharacterized cupin superfamily protein
VSTPTPPLLRAADIKAREEAFSHPWNPNSNVSMAVLGRALGLKRTGVNIARVPPGKESFLPHSHQREEEWVYVLAGRAIAEIDGAEHEVGPGDFMAFPAPSVVHHLRNPFAEELVYLMGGENLEFEIEDFPTVGKRMLRRGAAVDIYELADARTPGEAGLW